MENKAVQGFTPSPQIKKENAKRLDPRSVILIVIVNSIIAVLVQNILSAALSALLILLFSITIKADVRGVFKRCRRLWQVVIFAAIMQSIFVTQGEPVLKMLGMSFLTTHGIILGGIIILRLFAIMCGAAALSGYSQGELIEALTSFKLPYEFAYMVIIGIKFLPILKEEMQDSIVAIQLRGIELEKLKWGQKIKIYAYLLFPIVSGTIVRAKDLSESMEVRGFRAFKTRTSMVDLKFNVFDFMAMGLFISIEILIVLQGVLF